MNKSSQKYNSLVVKTDHQTVFDSRWSELKIDGKNIPSRSNHVSAFFNNKFYVHGGYDADKGVLADFYNLDIAEDVMNFEWKKLNNNFNGNPIRLKNHRSVVYKTNMYVFGGQAHNNQSINDTFVYDFVEQTWKKPKVSGKIPPKIDSHACCQSDGKMYLFSGYMPQTANYLKDIYCLDLQKLQWSLVYESKPGNDEPEGRSNLDMCVVQDKIWIFGGSNGQTTLDDFWKFDLKLNRWQNIENKNGPDARRGLSMVSYKNYIFLFGGIQDITKQKNDIYVYHCSNNKWNKIHTSTNSIYDCSPTLKQQRRKSPTKSPDRLTLHKVSPQKDKNNDVMKKILNENKQKKFMEKKKQLLKQFSQKPNEYSKTRSLSPTTESMLKTLQSIGNQEVSRKQLKQEIIYDQSHRYIIGKKPCARDGQTVTINNDKMYIFGGDRHLMAFNDLYCFDLEKGIKSIDLYKNN